MTEETLPRPNAIRPFWIIESQAVQDDNVYNDIDEYCQWYYGERHNNVYAEVSLSTLNASGENTYPYLRDYIEKYIGFKTNVPILIQHWW